MREQSFTMSVGTWDIHAIVRWDDFDGKGNKRICPPSREIDRVDVVAANHFPKGMVGEYFNNGTEFVQYPMLMLSPPMISGMGAGWVQYLVNLVWDYVEENPWILGAG